MDEFGRIFSDVFLRNSHMYIKIIEILSSGIKELEEIKRLLGGKNTYGRASEHLRELELAGFISRDYTWYLNTGKPSRISCFRLKDNYMRFYLKYIRPNINKIKNNGYVFKTLNDLPNWNTIIGLQFETLVINSAELLIKTMGLHHSDIVYANPFFQRKKARVQGCQIDYLLQTRFRTLYICEIKFSQQKLGSKIVKEMQEKMDRLKIPRGFSVRPVLIHVNGVEESLNTYFSHIIDMSQLMNLEGVF